MATYSCCDCAPPYADVVDAVWSTEIQPGLTAREILAAWLRYLAAHGSSPPRGGGDSDRRYLRRSQFANRKRKPEERTEPQAIPLRPVDSAQTAQALADFTARQMQRAGLDKARVARPAALQMPAAAADAQGANSLLLAAMIALLEDED